MIRGFEILFLFIAVLGFIVFGANRFLASEQKRRLRKQAHFLGGPLDGTDRQMQEFAPTYVWAYDEPVMVKGYEDKGRKYHENQPRLQNAIYDHSGDGAYVYRGSVAANDVLTYDVDPEN